MFNLLLISAWFGVMLTALPRTKNERFYKLYLRSSTWSKRRKQQYDLQNGLCKLCKKPMDKFHCHHENADYGTLGQEMVGCCIGAYHVECHNIIHTKLNKRSLVIKLLDKTLLLLKRSSYSMIIIANTLTKLLRLKK